jgi:hypothetical protein
MTFQKSLVQSGSDDPSDTPYNKAGLNGEGYIVGVIDGGVDDLSCFFIDSSGSQTTRSSLNAPIVEANRRKVVQYIAWANSGTTEYFGTTKQGREHGQWTSGALLGSCIGDQKNKGSQYNGIASSAKLSFFDYDAYDVPLNFDFFFTLGQMQFYSVAYNAGARIFSNSWGIYGSSGYYSSAVELDRYLYEHPEALWVGGSPLIVCIRMILLINGFDG